MASSPPFPPRWLVPALSAVAGLALAGPALVVLYPALTAGNHPRARAVIEVPQSQVPAVEPVALQQLTPDDARALNANVPFVTGPNPAARPFYLGGGAQDRARAVDCLAAAMLYEAGDDATGERAVGQVVINRARHPAFPKTICDVVFQGQERSTGCQFTFTCDGALARAPSPDAWRRAQALAADALDGRVFAPVGHATHYHTDWVVPYWSASLDKVAAVHTHLFFRWTGWWGTPPAFRGSVGDTEPMIAKLAALSPAHAYASALDEAAALTAQANSVLATGKDGVGAAPIDPDTFLVTLDRNVTADLLPAFAKRACGDRDYCKLMGWTDRALTPTRLPLDQGQVARMAFSYLRDRNRSYDKPLWNCAVFKRADLRECMKVQVMVPRPLATPTPGLTAAPLPGAMPSSRPIPNAPAAKPTLRPNASATPRTLPPAAP